MKERPILFTGPMVRAILEGRKTQTRRLVTKRNVVPSQLFDGFQFDSAGVECAEKEQWFEGWYDWDGDGVRRAVHSRIQPGNTLWVRETFGLTEMRHWYDLPAKRDPSSTRWAYYKASFDRTPIRWRPSIHMPRWACRLTLSVIDVRLERVQDITPEDAIAEGSVRSINAGSGYSGVWERAAFAHLWDSINKKKAPWESNPWAWVYVFERNP